jgi:serine/threonine protein phosphatase PrpC
MRVISAALTHPGVIRDANEDTVGVGDWTSPDKTDSPRIFVGDTASRIIVVVADGIGGHAGGRIASSLVARHLGSSLLECPLCTRGIAEAIREVNAILYDEVARDGSLRGMGTTVAGFVAHGDRVWIFNVGDSRVYRLADGFLSQLSVDDVHAPATFGDDDPADRSGTITQALGGQMAFQEILPHVRECGVVPGLTIMSCTDGLYGVISLDAMESAIDGDLATSAERLRDLSLAEGAPDNISVILTRFGGDPPSSRVFSGAP